jgi:phosphinothricin acetyltransferase
MTVSIERLTAEHWPDVERIYAAGIATGHATFDAEPPTWHAFDAAKLSTQRLVAVSNDQVVGWVAASPTSPRSEYAGVVEHSVYIDPPARGSGVGGLLLRALVASTEEAGIWSIRSAVFPENVASLALHRSAGFRIVGTRERVARMGHGPMAGQWRDVVLIERRSSVVGQ